jgi:hypothetical protein
MPKKPTPDFVAPMQASSVKEPFDSPDWIFETKLDGYRAIAVVDSSGKARIRSRNHLPLESKFPMVLDSVGQLNLRSTRQTTFLGWRDDKSPKEIVSALDFGLKAKGTELVSVRSCHTLAQ